MQELVNGVSSFQQSAFAEERELFESLAGGQQPLALFITCSDSRIDPNLLTQTKPGELFVLRTAGNIVPRYGSVHGGEAATIEYAVNALKVPDIVICGHSHCGAMAGLLQPDAITELPAVQALLSHAEPARQVVEQNAELTDPKDRLAAAVEQNVLLQLEQLQTHPSVAAAVDRGEVRLHGWVYTFETGQVFAHCPEQGQFVEIKDVKP